MMIYDYLLKIPFDTFIFWLRIEYEESINARNNSNNSGTGLCSANPVHFVCCNMLSSLISTTNTDIRKVGN